jgi:predicted ribosomally synthesized peptide with nif11-like leader
MSIESAKAFLERVKNDEDFRKELEEQASAAERIKFVKAQGFDFTKEEIDSHKEELSDEELGGVAGGCGYDCWPRERCYTD